MAYTLLITTQRDQRPRHPPHAWVAGHGEDGDTPGGHVIGHWGKQDNTRPLMLRQRVLWLGGQIVQAREQATCND